MVFTFHASVFNIWHKAGGTELADRLVLLHVTGGISRTGGVSAWVHAAIVAARQVWRAATVSQANGEGGIAVLCAYADGTVVQDVAGFFSRARLFLSHVTRVLAFPVHARGVRRAVEVPGARQRVRGARQLADLVHHETVFAHAHGPVVPHLAPLVHLARVSGAEARVTALAGASVARQALGAIAVRRATDVRRRPRIQRFAFRVRVAGRVRHTDITLGAGASRFVQNHAAQGVDPAGATETARVHALQIYAGLFVRALEIAGAFALWITETSIRFEWLILFFCCCCWYCCFFRVVM